MAINTQNKCTMNVTKCNINSKENCRLHNSYLHTLSLVNAVHY